MGIYEPLTRHLASRSGDTWSTTFAEIEHVLRRPLPRSAYEHRPWWANQTSGHHSQARAWRDAGWETRDVDLKHGTVRFERRHCAPAQQKGGVAEPATPMPDLWAQARQFTGIDDRDKLIEAGLRALVQREAGKRLIAMGGTMPEAAAAPRKRPFA